MDRLIKYFVPEKYVLDIEIDKHAKTVGGRVTITGMPKAENVKFHAVGLSVDWAKINGKEVDFELADGVLTVLKVPQGDVTIEIGYHEIKMREE